MQSLKITRATGEVYECEITPVIEVEFETYHHGGYRKIFRENEKQTDLYWLAHACLKRVRPTIDPPIGVFGDPFLETLKRVEVTDDGDDVSKNS